MYRRVLIALLSWWFTYTLLAQEVLTQADVDAKTYTQYLTGDWKGLIDTGRKAIGQGIDFYYLSYRMGIAYYKLGKYRQSISYFEKTKKYKRNDIALLEYIYFAYLFAGQDEKAILLSREFGTGLKKAIPNQGPKLLKGIYTEDELGFIYDVNKAKVSDIDGSNNIYGEQNIIKFQRFNSLGFFHDAGYRVGLFHAYSNYQLNNTLFVKTDYFQDGIDLSVMQHQYYLMGNVNLSKNLLLHVAGHILWGSTEYINWNGEGNDPLYEISILDYSDYVIFTGLSTDISLFRITVQGGFAALNDKEQIQAGGILEFYPLGNLNLYFVSKLTSHSEFIDSDISGSFGRRGRNQSTNTNVEQNIIFEQKAGFLLKRVWLEAYINVGKIQNFADNSAYTVYNYPGYISARQGGNIKIPLLNYKLMLSLHYDFSRYNDYRIEYTSESDYEEYLFNYTIHSITGGIKWNF